MRPPASQREIDDLLLHLKDLIHLRALLEDRGAPTAEINAHAAEIDQVRDRLASLVRASLAPESAAA